LEPREHADDAKQFVEHVARELEVVDSIPIVGPASAKLEVFTAALNPRLLASRQPIIHGDRSPRANEGISRQATGG